MVKTQREPTDIGYTRPLLSQAANQRIGCSIAVAIVILGCLLVPAYADTQSGQYKEYEVKAAFIYNFLKFVDWPEEKMENSDKQIIIGIIGENPFGSAANVFKNKKVEDREVVLKYFESFEDIKNMSKEDRAAKEESLKNCHLLFICQSERKQVREITDLVSKSSVLTVGDMDGFTKSGGIINLFIEDNKIRFNINLTVADKNGLKVRSQLLRLAKNVYRDDSDEKDTDAEKKEGGAE